MTAASGPTTHAPVPCQRCRWCGTCGCDRGGLCHTHQHVDADIARTTYSRILYETQLAEGDDLFAEFTKSDNAGKIHALSCHVVRKGITAAERFLSDPLNATWPAVYPTLLTRDQAEQPGRKRCTQCAPDVRETKRPRRPQRSGLGWPLHDGTCARSPAF
jgi:hypothetical protein